MTLAQILAQLQAAGTEPTRRIYRRHGFGDDTYGVSYAELGKLKKQLNGRGKDRNQAHQLALALWPTGNFEARTLATMIADPAQLSPADAQAWAADLHNHSHADALAGLVAETSFAVAAAEEWMSARGEYPQRLGYALLARLALHNAALPDSFFEAYLPRIEAAIAQAPNRAKEGMNNALIALGSRSENLRQRVEAAADRIGQVEVDHGATACQTFEVRPYLTKVWARKAVKA